MGLKSYLTDGFKLTVAKIVVNKVLKVLTGDKLQEYMDKAFDKIEKWAAGTKNKVDDGLIYAVAVLREAWNIPNDDEYGVDLSEKIAAIRIAALKTFLSDGLEYLASDKVPELVSDGVAYLKEYFETTSNKLDDTLIPILTLVDLTFGADDDEAADPA